MFCTVRRYIRQAAAWLCQHGCSNSDHSMSRNVIDNNGATKAEWWTEKKKDHPHAARKETGSPGAQAKVLRAKVEVL